MYLLFINSNLFICIITTVYKFIQYVLKEFQIYQGISWCRPKTAINNEYRTEAVNSRYRDKKANIKYIEEFTW